MGDGVAQALGGRKPAVFAHEKVHRGYVVAVKVLVVDFNKPANRIFSKLTIGLPVLAHARNQAYQLELIQKMPKSTFQRIGKLRQ